MASFTDSRGRSWEMRLSVGRAMALRDVFGLDVDRLISPGSDELQRLIEDQWRIVEVVVFVLEDQLIAKGLTKTDASGKVVPTDDFLESLSGEILDDAALAFLEGVAESLPKLKRRALQSMIAKLSPAIETATIELEKRIGLEDLDKRIREGIAQIKM